VRTPSTLWTLAAATNQIEAQWRRSACRRRNNLTVVAHATTLLVA
jgi:hypothetical protein